VRCPGQTSKTMTGLVLSPSPAGGLGAPFVKDGSDSTSGHVKYAPVNFIYRSFHNSIRSELDSLSESVLALEHLSIEGDLPTALEDLKERYRFLEQVYKFHSSLEDEVRVAGWM
jgi:iron-sulfur cluster repair protein YtfE (RIC family)